MSVKLTENFKRDTKTTQKLFSYNVILVTIICNIWQNIEENKANAWNDFILVEKEKLNEIIHSWTERW